MKDNKSQVHNKSKPKNTHTRTPRKPQKQQTEKLKLKKKLVAAVVTDVTFKATTLLSGASAGARGCICNCGLTGGRYCFAVRGGQSQPTITIQ